MRTQSSCLQRTTPVTNALACGAKRSSRCGALLIAGVMAALVVSAPANAQERPVNRVEITPLVGYGFGGEFENTVDGTERDFDETVGFGLIVDVAADRWRHYEFLFATLDSEVGGTNKFDMGVQYLHLGGTVSHQDGQRVIPYFGLTIGATRFSPDQAGLGDETKLSFSAGGGVRIPIAAHIAVRFDARAFVTVLDSDEDIFCNAAGGASCDIRAKSDTFMQYMTSLGVTFAF